MKSQKSLTRLFKNAAAFNSSTQLFSEDELHRLLESAPVSIPPSRVVTNTHRWRNIMFGSTILAGATAALLWFNVNTTDTILQKSGSVRENQPAVGSLKSAEQNNDAAPLPVTSLHKVGPASQGLSNNVVSGNATLHDTLTIQRSAPRMNESLTQESLSTTETDRTQARTANSVVSPTQIEGLHALELGDEDLAKLGIQRRAEGIALTAQLHYDQQDPVALNVYASNSGLAQNAIVFKQKNLGAVVQSLGYNDKADALTFSIELDSFSVLSRLEEARKLPAPRVYPLIVSHESRDLSSSTKSQVLIYGNSASNAADHGRFSDELATLFELYKPARSRHTMDNVKLPLLSKLVAVRVALGDVTKSGAEILLWYYPSDEFLALLPAELGDKIRDERDRINQTQDQPRQNNSIEPRFQGEYTFTGIDRSQNGNLEIVGIGPNPARDEATLRFRTSDVTDVQIVVYDMSGRLVTTLESRRALAGMNHVPLQLQSLSSGAYLLSIVTDRNEQAIQRFIIQK